MSNNQLDAVSELSKPSNLSGQMSVEHYTRMWIRAFPLAQTKGKRYWKMRLAELESWDNSNNKHNEHAGKIAALKYLINEQR